MSTPDPFPGLAAAAAIADAAERELTAAAAVRELLLATPDELTLHRIRADVKRRRLMSMGMFDALAAEAAALVSGCSPAAAAAPPQQSGPPQGAREVPGSPGWAYRPADTDRPGDPGALFEQRRQAWARVNPWAPAVARFLETPDGDGGATAYYYEIAAGGRSVVTSGDELAMGEPWKLLPVTGTGAKRVREVLANVVLAEAARLELAAALTRTGWHADADGARFYVFADGRTSDGREVCLVPKAHYRELAAAAHPLPPAELGDVVTALLEVAEHGRGPGLAGIGIGVRSLAHSLHKVPGGFIAVGPPNAGKSSLAWHARTLLIARQGRANAWPPLPSATFEATPTRIETAVDYEADMPALLDDGAVHDKSTRADVADLTAKLERVYRALANDAEQRGRMDRTMLPRESRYVRSPVIATVQGSVADVPVQNSLLRRLLLLPVTRGDVDIKWYRSKDGNAARLVRPLRTLGEQLVIPWLAALGDDAAAYVAAKDAEALELLTAELDAELPGWDESAEGLAGVADIAACALSGLLIAAEVSNLTPALLTAEAVPYLIQAIAAQSARMGDSAADATPAEALGEIMRAALLDGRAHVRDDQDAPRPVIPGLTEQEQGLELLGVAPEYSPRYRGRGVPLYWLPDDGAVGVPAEGLHKLIRAAADGRVPVKTARTLPGYLVAEGLAVPSDQKTSKDTHQKRLGNRNARLVFIHPEVFSTGITENHDDGTATTATTATPQADDIKSNSNAREDAATTATPQVNGQIEPASPPISPRSIPASDVPGSGCSGSTATALSDSEPMAPDLLAEALGGRSIASYAGTSSPSSAPGAGRVYGPRDATTVLMAHGRRVALRDGAYYVDGELAPPEVLEQLAAELEPGTYAATPVVPAGVIMCGPRPPTAGDLEQVARFTEQPDVAEGQAAAPAPAIGDEGQGDAPAAAEGRHRFLVIGADGRAYGHDGEIVPMPPGRLEACADAGQLAALALELGAERLYVPRPARELLGLPAEVPDAPPKQGYPHRFTEGTDPARWDIWPAEPVGVAGWMNVYRMPSSLHEGVALAFPEWLPRTPELAALEPPELARALSLIHQATTHHGEGSGGVEFYRSPAATFGRLLDKAARYSRRGHLEAVELPPPYDRKVKRPRGAPALRPPGPHMAPPAEVPPGWIIAQLDVRSCFASAATGTDFGIGEAVHSKPGRLDKSPGVHLVRAAAAAAVIHPALMPWLPESRGRDVLAWLDTHAALWLAECGVPLQVVESWTWPKMSGSRVFDTVTSRLGEARKRLEAAADAPSLAAAAVVKAMANTFLGGWLASDFGGERRGDDWKARYDWWLTVRTQAEVRKQRNLLPALKACAVLVLGEQQVDSVYVAAPSLEALEAMPGSGGRPAIAESRGKFKCEQHAEVTPELAAALADPKGSGHARLAAIRTALANGE